MKIICVGKNYEVPEGETGDDVLNGPSVFTKPDSAILRNNDSFYIPEWTSEVFYEIELVLRINRMGKNIEEKFAHRYYDEIGLGIDFTANDVLQQLKENGLPWEKAKAFDQSAVLSNVFFPKSIFPDEDSIFYKLDINGDTVQEGDSGLMAFSFEELIAYISKYMTLKIGDLIFTGTPLGSGPVNIGDHLEGYLENKKLLDFMVK